MDGKVKDGRAGTELHVMGVEMRFLCPAEHTGGAWSLMETVIAPEAGPPPHWHPWGEAYYVLDGQVRFHQEGAERVLGKGEFIYVPGGSVHGFRGASREPARMLIFDAPAHSEAFFRELEREVKEMPRDIAKAWAVGERHQVRFLHPAGIAG